MTLRSLVSSVGRASLVSSVERASLVSAQFWFLIDIRLVQHDESVSILFSWNSSGSLFVVIKHFLEILMPIYSEFKGAFSGLGQYLGTESPLKLMKNAFYFTLEAAFVPKIFKFLP